jgi:hypothetical protein
VRDDRETIARWSVVPRQDLSVVASERARDVLTDEKYVPAQRECFRLGPLSGFTERERIASSASSSTGIFVEDVRKPSTT